MRHGLRILLAGLIVMSTGLFSTVVAVGPAAANGSTPVTCGSVIIAPGDYHLAGDCTGPIGIEIRADDVDLKLNGHTITCSIQLIFIIGILVFPSSDVDIKGPGKITNCGFGISFGASNSDIVGVTLTGNSQGLSLSQSTGTEVLNNVIRDNSTGLDLSNSSENEITGNVVNRNSFSGIRLSGSNDNDVTSNRANNNGALGIQLTAGSSDNDVNRNTALGNMTFDLSDTAPNCDDNDWRNNRFQTRNMNCIH